MNHLVSFRKHRRMFARPLKMRDKHRILASLPAPANIRQKPLIAHIKKRTGARPVRILTMVRLFLLALLIADGARGFARRLTRGLAFAAAFVFGVGKISFFDDLNVFHSDSPLCFTDNA